MPGGPAAGALTPLTLALAPTQTLALTLTLTPTLALALTLTLALSLPPTKVREGLQIEDIMLIDSPGMTRPTLTP